MNRIWQACYGPNTAFDIDPDQYASLNVLFEQSFQKHGLLPAFSSLGTKMTYCELEQKSRYFSAYLQSQLQLKKGDRVAIMMPNLLQYPVALFGILRAGLIVVNLNPLYTASEVEYLLKDSGADTIIVLANFAKTLEKVLETVQLRQIIITEVGDLLGGVKKQLVNFVVKYIKRQRPSFLLPHLIQFNDVLKYGHQYRYQLPEINGQDAAFLQYTGGTTGRPKGAVLTHRNIVANVLQCQAWLGDKVTHPGKTIVLTALPLYHIFSLTVCCMTFMVFGAECLLIANPRDIKHFLSTLSKVPVTIFVGLNTLFKNMMAHSHFSKANFSQLKLTIAGGMATEASVATAWQEKTGIPILQGYGLTEASPVVSINPIHLTKFNDSVGIPIPSTDIELREGELCVKGPQIMQAYWHKSEQTAKALDNKGWLLTGDIARVDDRGFIYIIDRKKDMILVSGFNVYPSEIEKVLLSYVDIKEAAVVGIADEKTGEAIKAFIVKKNPTLTPQRIINYCQQSLTHYKIPKYIEFCDYLPKSNIGKVLKTSLRKKEYSD